MSLLSTYGICIMSRKAANFWWNFHTENKVIIPPEVSYYTKEGRDDKWIPVTWKEVFLKRKEKNLYNIIRKSRCDQGKILPCYVWVFKNEFAFPFGGWYIYIQTLKNDYPLNFRTTWRNKDVYSDLIEKIKEMFPVFTLTFDFEDWGEEFVKRYPKKSKKRNKEGAVFCRCKIDEYGDVVDIIKNK